MDTALFGPLFEHAPDMIVVTDNGTPPERWPTIVTANAAFLRDTGYAREDIIGMTSDILFANQQTSEKESIAKSLRARTPSVATFLSKRKDGSTFRMEARSRPIFDDDGAYEYRVIVARNVSEQRAAIERLQMFEAAFEQASDGIVILEPLQGEVGSLVVYANDAFIAQTGYDANEVDNAPSDMFFGKDTDHDEIVRLRAALQAGRSALVEVLLYRKDGTSFHSTITAYALSDPHGGIVRWLLFLRDVGESRRIELELEVLRTAMEVAEDSIIVYEMRGEKRDAPHILFMNEAVVRNSGFTREELLSQSTGVGPETDRAALAELTGNLVSGKPARVRLRLYRKDGSKYWGLLTANPIKNSRGEVTHAVTIERDVTNSISREQQLERDNRVLATLIDVSRGLFGALNSAALRQHLLDGIEKLTGVVPVEHAGLLALADPFLQRASQSRAPILDRMHDRAAFAVPGTPSSPAAILEIDAASAGLRLERTVILSLQLLAQSYRTAQQNAALYEELGEQREAVVELNQTKSDLIAMMAHDFRGPLTAIMGFAELLRNEDVEQEERNQMLDTILESSRSLTRLANDTLAMAHMEENDLTLDVEPLDFSALARSVATMYRDEREVRVETPTESGPVVRADRGRIRQALENLVGNAIKYSPGGGEVTIRVEAVGGSVRVSVRDKGIGVPPEEVERIFARFARASNAAKSGISGSGFGLYISAQIVRRHGGRMWVESELGKGSSFIFELPLVSAIARTPRILLGDSAGNVRSLAAHALRAGGRSVKVCAVWDDLFRELSSAEFDAAVLDAESFGHPGDSVQTFLDACNAARIPVVLVGVERSERFEGYAASLRKPYMIADLVDTVGRLDGERDEAPSSRAELEGRHQ